MNFAIFDMDGVLLDSMQIWSKAFTKPLDDNHIKYPKDILKIITPLGIYGTVEYFKSLGYNASIEEINNSIQTVIKNEYLYNIELKPYVVEYLEKLKSQGVKMCILTCSNKEYSIPCLERLDILKYFDFFCSTDDLGSAKDDTNTFIVTAKRLGADISEVEVYDDNATALKTASMAGAYVTGVYDKFSEQYEDEIKMYCNRYIKSFKELI